MTHDEAKKKYEALFDTVEAKAEAFDLLAERFYFSNFGSMPKADIDLLMFKIYLDKLLERDQLNFSVYSDYALSKQLGITQAISTIEFSFDASNFLHLTGLKIVKKKQNGETISAREFYDLCLAHRLSASDFELAKDGTTQLKLEVLPKLISKNLSANMVGDYQEG